jgi:hypothetical protein
MKGFKEIFVLDVVVVGYGTFGFMVISYADVWYCWCRDVISLGLHCNYVGSFLFIQPDELQVGKLYMREYHLSQIIVGSARAR